MVVKGNHDDFGSEKLKGLMKILPEQDEVKEVLSYSGMYVCFVYIYIRYLYMLYTIYIYEYFGAAQRTDDDYTRAGRGR